MPRLLWVLVGFARRCSEVERGVFRRFMAAKDWWSISVELSQLPTANWP